MNKAWITGLTLAGVAGSAGAAFAGIAADNQGGSSVEAQGLAAETSTSAAATQTATYQVGAAGTVTLTAANGAITVDSALPGAYWTLVGYGTPAAHVEVQFADAAQQVTFVADLVNDDVVVSVTNVPAPGATTTSIEVTQITGGGSVAAPQPATPAANKPIVVAVPAPGASHTSATSSAGGDDEDEHEEEHEYEDEGDDD
ncbi:MAG: hypothetical protein HY828_01635 [Actinobacteria bacterium]|nr:hypothetical protein [Actinomycetota bacterium]